MKKIILFALLGLLALSAVGAREIAGEPSKYGRFSVVVKGESCEIRFQRTGIGSRLLLTVPNCVPGFALGGPVAEETAGKSKLPFLAVDDQEFHLFRILTARGGNACDGYDYYAVVIGPERLWATRQAFASACVFEEADLAAMAGSSALRLVAPATTTTEGLSCLVGMGGVKTTKIPRLPRKLVSTKTVSWQGRLSSGCHATNWLPFVEEGREMRVIDHPGECALKAYFDRMVVLRAEVKTWSDGAEEATCLSVTPAP